MVRSSRGLYKGYIRVIGMIWGLPRPSNVVPFWVWYGFLARTLRTTKKVLHWRV